MMLTTFRMPDITMTQPTLQLACHTCTTWYTYQMFPPPVWQAQLSTCKRRPEANNTELSGTTGTRTWCIFYNKLLITSLTFTCAMVASNRYNCHWRLYILTGQTSWPPSELCIQRQRHRGHNVFSSASWQILSSAHMCTAYNSPETSPEHYLDTYHRPKCFNTFQN